MFVWLESLVDQATTLARNIAILVAIVSIIVVWYKTKALVPVLATVLLAAVALWAVSASGITTIQGWVEGTNPGIVFADLLSRATR